MRGERAHDAAPHGHWGVRTLIGSIRGDGQTTCMTIDAPTDKDIFLAYVRNVLVPSLRRGDIVVLDNLRSHKVPEVVAAIRSAGPERNSCPLLAGPESHRKDVEQDQDHSACDCSPDIVRPASGHPESASARHGPRCRCLVLFMRLYYFLNRSSTM